MIGLRLADLPYLSHVSTELQHQGPKLPLYNRRTNAWLGLFYMGVSLGILDLVR